MISDETALLAAIRERPEDDLPRLVYADLLEGTEGTEDCGRCNGFGHFNQGDDDYKDCYFCSRTGRISNGCKERAEFIRDQIAHGLPLNRHDHGFRMPVETRRDAQLLNDHGQEWVRTAAAAFGLSRFGFDHGFFGGMGQLSFVWQRGFIAEIHCPIASWLDHGPAIVRSPVACVERVELTDREPHPSTVRNGHYVWFRDGSTRVELTDREPHPSTVRNGHYVWFRDGSTRLFAPLIPGDGQSWLPGVIFKILNGSAIPFDLPLAHKEYATRGLANTELSAACIAWAWKAVPA